MSLANLSCVDPAWVVLPLAYQQHNERTVLVPDDIHAAPLDPVHPATGQVWLQRSRIASRLWREPEPRISRLFIASINLRGNSSVQCQRFARR